MGAIGWYGPLIDLSRAASHIGDYVQLLVFVHKSAPVQYKLSRGGEAIRTDIQVGDDSRSFFSVSIWQKEMGSMTFSGCIILLQNVKITRFHQVVEASTVQYSSVQCLVQHDELIRCKGVNNIMKACRAGVGITDKLRKVIEWLQHAGSSFHEVASHRYQAINWKVHEERVSQDCYSLAQVLRLTHSCKAVFLATIGELFIPLNLKLLQESEERMFISRRVCMTGEKDLVEDLICNGCQLCGSPLDSHSSWSTSEQCTLSLYCPKNPKHTHNISTIYRPFMLYVWDDSDCIPILVKNKAAEILFGNIKAEKVYSCYKRQKNGHTLNLNRDQKKDHHKSEGATHRNDVNWDICVSQVAREKSGQSETKLPKAPDFYLIWIVLVKILVQQGKNSPLRLKIEVNVDRNIECGRFELVSLSMPCFGT